MEALLNGVSMSSSCLCGVFFGGSRFLPQTNPSQGLVFKCCSPINKSWKSPATNCFCQSCTQKHGLSQKLPGSVCFQPLSPLSAARNTPTQNPGAHGEVVRSELRQGQLLWGIRPRHNRWQADDQQRSLSSILKSPVNQSTSFSWWLSCLLTDGTVWEENRRKQEGPKQENDALNSVFV